MRHHKVANQRACSKWSYIDVLARDEEKLRNRVKCVWGFEHSVFAISDVYDEAQNDSTIQNQPTTFDIYQWFAWSGSKDCILVQRFERERVLLTKENEKLERQSEVCWIIVYLQMLVWMLKFQMAVIGHLRLKYLPKLFHEYCFYKKFSTPASVLVCYTQVKSTKLILFYALGYVDDCLTNANRPCIRT